MIETALTGERTTIALRPTSSFEYCWIGGCSNTPVAGLKMLIAQLGSLPPASVKLTGRFNRVASLRARRRPLLIASDVERTSALRRNVVNDGRPASEQHPRERQRHHELQHRESAGPQ